MGGHTPSVKSGLACPAVGVRERGHHSLGLARMETCCLLLQGWEDGEASGEGL